MIPVPSFGHVNGTIPDQMTAISPCNSLELGLYKRPMSREEMEEIKRHFGVVAESLRSDIQQIAAGHEVIRRELQTQREELKDEFKDTKSLMRLSFSQLDQRVHTLESDVSAIKSRVDGLESSRA